MASPQSTPRQDKRVRIIDAAVEVFAERGFRGARISDIAKSAGVADGTIYLYFRNKEDLLLTIFEEKMADVLARLEVALRGVEGPLERIRAFAHFHFQQMRTNPSLAQVLQVELRQSTRFLRDYRPEKLWRYLDAFEQLLSDGQAAGVVRAAGDPHHVNWALLCARGELTKHRVGARRRERFDLDRAADQVVDVFLQGVRPRG